MLQVSWSSFLCHGHDANRACAGAVKSATSPGTAPRTKALVVAAMEAVVALAEAWVVEAEPNATHVEVMVTSVGIAHRVRSATIVSTYISLDYRSILTLEHRRRGRPRLSRLSC